VQKAGIVVAIGEEDMGPTGASAIGAHDVMLWVSRVFCSEDDVEISSFDAAIPGHGVAKLDRRHGFEGCFFRDVDVFEPIWSCRKAKRH